MADARPPITSSLTLSEFTSWYWLKTELICLCRTFGLSTSGSKLELEDSLRRHLSGRAPIARTRRRTAGEMPTTFTPRTMIGKGWRCNPALGAYFRQAVGSGFHFNATVRDFIHTGVGHTLAEAAVGYLTSIQPGAPKPCIPRQLEYNQHFKDFFATHPEASRQQAIDAWWQRRSRRNGTVKGS